MAELRGLSDGGYRYFDEVRRASSYARAHEGRIGIVVGNGESRAPLDLWRLRHDLPSALVLACNSYYRDVERGLSPVPHFLGAVDPAITKEIMESGYADQYPFLVNPISLECAQNLRWKDRGENPGPLRCPRHLIEVDWRMNGNCGVEMANFALRTGCSSIILLGFDGPTDDEDSVNNIYKDYPGCDATAFSPHPGRLQMRILRKDWEGVPFFQVATSWIENAETISYDDVFSVGVGPCV